MLLGAISLLIEKLQNLEDDTSLRTSTKAF